MERKEPFGVCIEEWGEEGLTYKEEFTRGES